MKRQRTGNFVAGKGQPAFKKANTKPTGNYQKGREMAKAPKSELKAFDTALAQLAPATIAAVPVPVTLNAVVNGAELYQRVGRKMYMKSLHFRGQFAPTGVATEGAVRLIIYYDSQPNTANPLIGALLQDSNAAAATTWASEINLTNRQRFQILRDYQVLCGQSANVGGSTELVPDPIKNSYNIDFFIPLKGLETIFNATNGGTIADITSGAIQFMLICDGQNTGWALNYHARLRYYD